MQKFILFALLILSSANIIAQPITPYNIVKNERRAAAKTTALVYNPALKPFYHGVASGDPTTTSVIIWTRITPETPSITKINGTYEVATDTGMKTIVKSGNFTADTGTDFTVNIDVTGLSAGTTYYYRFKTGGISSLVGRAKTIPAANVTNLKFAIVSCSNYEGGYFNAYGSIAQRNDLDAVIHLGDYIYEYEKGAYGIGLSSRQNEPATEILTLADYRTRYSLYRLDAELIRLHQQHTFITIWDDHESANDSYVDGAENHNTGEGDWNIRKAVSKRVYFEWMPIRENAQKNIYRKISYGNLCDILMLDTRLEGRQSPPAHFDTPDTGTLARIMISSTQENWLMNNLQQSTATWKIVGNQVLFSAFNVGFAGGFSDGVPDPTNIDSIRGAEDLFIDNWESYPTQRMRILTGIRDNNVKNVVFVTGDSHCSWAFDVPVDPVDYPNPLKGNIPTANTYNTVTKKGYNRVGQEGSWAVEYGTPSISSPNFDEAVGAAVTAQFEYSMNNPLPAPFPAGTIYNPHLRFVDLDKHGYFLLDVKQDSVHADFYYVSRIDTSFATVNNSSNYKTLKDTNEIHTATGPAPAKTTQDIPTPVAPPATGIQHKDDNMVLFGLFPNPAGNDLYLQIGLQYSSIMQIVAYDLAGRKVAVLVPQKEFPKGLYNIHTSLSGIKMSGQYIIRFEGTAVNYSFKLNVTK